MQPVFGLIESHALGTFDDLVGNFLTTMRGQTMHDDCILFCQGNSLASDLVTLEGF